MALSLFPKGVERSGASINLAQSSTVKWLGIFLGILGSFTNLAGFCLRIFWRQRNLQTIVGQKFSGPWKISLSYGRIGDPDTRGSPDCRVDAGEIRVAC